MNESILDSIKKALGIDPAYTVFDQELVMFINGVFTTLTQLKVGPEEGFRITGKNEEWPSYVTPADNLENVKTYMYLRVRLIFDPPATSYAINAFQEQAKELEWRMNVQVDHEPPPPPATEWEAFFETHLGR